MACESWRDKLDAYFDNELTEPEAVAVAGHLRQCATCAADALERVQLKRSIAAAGKRYAPDAALRAKVRQAIGVPRPGSGLWRWKAALIPALLILIVALLTGWFVEQDRARRQYVYSELADLHVATLASGTQVDVLSSDRHTVKPWFEGKIPFAFNLPELQGTEYALIGGRVTYLAQTPGAHLIYRIRKHEVSVFIFQDRSAQTAGLRSGPATALSFSVESWTKNGLRYFVVGDVSADDLAGLSKLLRDAA